jgi:hypothetical protein
MGLRKALRIFNLFAHSISSFAPALLKDRPEKKRARRLLQQPQRGRNPAPIASLPQRSGRTLRLRFS